MPRRESSMKQHQIDEILVQACTAPCKPGEAGRRVVRLKGGDPAVFSRASSEAAALSAACVSFEFVPGVSSALAAPLLAGLPLTDAAVGSSFAVVSGHDVEGTDWRAFAGIPTLVVLMAGKGLPRMVERLMAADGGARDGDTPVALVREAGLPTQRVFRANLKGLVTCTKGETLSPCVIIVGKVAALPQTWGALLA